MGATGRHRAGMRWDDGLARLFDDLEQQAEGLALVERDTEVAEAVRAEYSQVDLVSRLHGSLGLPLRLAVAGVGTVEGELRRAGDGWCLLDTGQREWVVRLPAVSSVRGLADRGVVASARPLTARLGLASVLRGLVEMRAESVLHRTDSTLLAGPARPGRRRLRRGRGERRGVPATSRWCRSPPWPRCAAPSSGPPRR